MPFDHIISIGATCTPAWQIRSHFPGAKAFPFDWRITPWPTMVSLIENDFQGFAEPDQFYISDDKKSVFHKKYEIDMPHDFHKSGKFIADDWEEYLDGVVQKFKYLIDRWSSVMESRSRILFVRHQGNVVIGDNKPTLMPVNDAKYLCELLQNKARGSEIKILFVNAVDGNTSINACAKTADVRYANETDWPNESDRWKGATTEWAKVFENI
ncbi:MAG: hypothetical protein GX458_04545 [Phyllobacteriaceae bacterium]|nr:hypothetical protein [Phyllobacteriaceae bacterium]